MQSSTYTVYLLYDVFDDDSSLLDVVIREAISRHVLKEDLHCCPVEFESLYLCSGCEKRKKRDQKSSKDVVGTKIQFDCLYL